MTILLPYRALAAPIHGYVGPNGSGKSALAVKDAWSMSKGKCIYSNITLTPPDGWYGELYKITSLADFAGMEDGHVLVDEVNAVFPSRGTMNLPHEFLLWLSTLRKRNLTFGWTTPAYAQADTTIRRVTQSVTAVRPLISRKDPNGGIWPRTVVSSAVAYDTRSVLTDDIEVGTPRRTDGFLRLKSLPLNSYNTKEDVMMIADHLICRDCGLPLRQGQCKAGGLHDANDKASLSQLGKRERLLLPYYASENALRTTSVLASEDASTTLNFETEPVRNVVDISTEVTQPHDHNH